MKTVFLSFFRENNMLNKHKTWEMEAKKGEEINDHCEWNKDVVARYIAAL